MDQHTVPDPCATPGLQQRACACVLYLHALLRSGVDLNTALFSLLTLSLLHIKSWGIVIGGTILQNTLLRDLPKDFTATLPQGVQIAYAVIPRIKNLPDSVQLQVRSAFARSTKLIWQVMIGFSGAGLFTVFLMREETLRRNLDEQWGLRERDNDSEQNIGVTTAASKSAVLVTEGSQEV